MIHSELTIIGAGPAGLAAGFYARRARIPFTLFEANETVGGNARTLRAGDFSFDTGAHRFHSQDEAATRDLLELMGDELLQINVPSQIVFNGRFIDFPLSPLNLIGNFGVSNLIRACFGLAWSRLFKQTEQTSFESAVVTRYGKTIADAFLLGYTEKLWGVPPSQLSPRVSGKRLQGLNLRTFLIEAFGGSRVKTEHLDGRFFYPRSGIGAIMDHFAAACGHEQIRLKSRITRLYHTDHRISEIEINEAEQIPVSEIISTLPLSVLLRNLHPAPPADMLDAAKRIQFRNVVLVALFLDRERITPNASLYFPDRTLPFTRIYEPRNRSIKMAPNGKTSLVVEIPTGFGSQNWTANDSDLVERTIEQLSSLRLIRKTTVLDSMVCRIPFAYPVLKLGFEETVEKLLTYLSRFENLHIIGRNSEFAYTHIHDLMKAGREAVQKLKRPSEKSLLVEEPN
ncbi:FAD-dependent oxidoreductase [bacterium]|nr:FAD-dependent oxidoreductase [bacterium]